SELVRVSSLEPESSAQEERVTCDGVCGFVEHSPASVIKWKISSHDPGITVVGSELTGLGGLLYNDEVDSCFVELGCVDVCKASEPCSGNQAVGFIVNFYALSLAAGCELKYRLQHSCPYAKEYRGHVGSGVLAGKIAPSCIAQELLWTDLQIEFFYH
ncbi:unnamed protein product, partial [Porites evermanni]